MPLSRVRLAILAIVSLIAPITGAVLLSRLADTPAARLARTDELVVIAASVVLFLLVIARMAGLVRTQEQSAARERALREAGLALVTATNRDAIHEAAIEAARTLAGEDAAVRLCEEPEDAPDELVVVAAEGGTGDVLGLRFSLSILQEWKRQRLLRARCLHRPCLREHAEGPAGAPPEDRGNRARGAPVHA